MPGICLEDRRQPNTWKDMAFQRQGEQQPSTQRGEGSVQCSRLARRGLHVDVLPAIVRLERVHREAVHVVEVAGAAHEVVAREGLLARVLVRLQCHAQTRVVRKTQTTYHGSPAEVHCMLKRRRRSCPA
jgi:hypothetical protein